MFKKSLVLSFVFIFPAQMVKPIHPFVGFKIAQAVTEVFSVAKEGFTTNFKDELKKSNNNHFQKQHDASTQKRMPQKVKTITFDKNDIINSCLLAAL